MESFFKHAKTWREEMGRLRPLLLEGGLTEEFKWGKPCYTYEGSNLVVLVPLKAHCALLFFKGVLLKDSKRVLIKPGENSQSARWMKFASLDEITAGAAVVRDYLREAVDVAKAGTKVVYKKPAQLTIPVELQTKWKEQPALKKAFKALTPGRQRAYLLHFTAAKQSQTRERRIEKSIDRILAGKGLDDR